MRVLEISDIQQLIHHTGLDSFYQQLIEQLKSDFSRWPEFIKTPRHATHFPHGVIELMPCSDKSLYSFKFVNGHPMNTQNNNLCVAALGVLAKVDTGYPFLLSEMTLLTALRTAAVGALGAEYLARKNSHVLCIIGTGAQSEFQAQAMRSVYNITEIRIFDTDPQAMKKFMSNLDSTDMKISPCESSKQAVTDADIIITATATKSTMCLFNPSDIAPGTHIHAMGGDCPGKTELDTNLLKNSKIVVEFTEQSLIEGEIQQLDSSHIHAELWEIINQSKVARENNNEITIFDSVGFALEDFSTLILVNKLAEEYGLGKDIDLIPDLSNPKDLYSLLK